VDRLALDVSLLTMAMLRPKGVRPIHRQNKTIWNVGRINSNSNRLQNPEENIDALHNNETLNNVSS
jgi:hypothetical protein